MERALVWMKCAAMHDPVRPVLKMPAAIGWEAKKRQVELTIDRPFRGDELLMRMKGWVTADVKQAVQIFEQFGILKLIDEYDLVIETPDKKSMEALSRNLAELFNEEVWVEPIEKDLLK
jgi:hypothetical protein